MSETGIVLDKKNEQIISLIKELFQNEIEGLREKMDDRFDSVEKEIGNVNQKVGDIKKVLNGNGTPGLIKQVESNRSDIEILKKGLSNGTKAFLVAFAFLVMTHLDDTVKVIQSAVKNYLRI